MNNDSNKAAVNVDGGDEVETCEVHFVPLEDDGGVFSGGEESYYSDNEPVPVVLEEKVKVQDEGDVVPEVIEIKDDDDDEDNEGDDEDDVDVDFENKMADKRKIQKVYQSVGDEDDEDDGLEGFMRSTRMKSAKFWIGQTKSYESKIDELRKELALVKDGFRAAKRMVDRHKEDLDRLVEVNTQLQDEKWELHERNQKLHEENCRREMVYEAGARNKRIRIEELENKVEQERKTNEYLELELSNTRKRLLRFTRWLIPRRTVRVVRRVDSYEDGEESCISEPPNSSSEDEENRVIKLVNIMNEL